MNQNRLMIVRRQSPDWGAISPEDFRIQARQFCVMAGLPVEQVNMTVDLWDRSFKQTYCSVRQALKDIAADNLKAIQEADLINIDNLVTADIAEEKLYLFIDDDDWVCPEIVSQVPVLETNKYDGIVWGSVAFGTHKAGALQIRAIDGFCYTNNYAVTGHALKSALDKGASPAQHWDAQRLLKGSAQIIDQYLSVTNKSPSSTCYLMHVLKGDYADPEPLKGAIQEYVNRCYRYQEMLPESLSWAVPLMDKTLKVFAGL